MSGVIVFWSINIAQTFLLLAMGCCVIRMIRGPRAQDRIVSLDALYVSGMLLLITFGMRMESTIYFEAALVIALFGFISTAALAKFLMRGEVIE